MNKPHTFVFFGIVGSGKGTQVGLLSEYLKKNSIKTSVVTAGDEFRKIISEGTYTGKIIKDRFDAGFLQPNFLTITLISNAIINSMSDDNALIIDGYPRTIEQSEALEATAEFYKRDDVKIVYIDLSKEEATKRMKLRGRSDDTEEGIAQRFREYENNVLPSMNYFEGKEGYTIHRINGDQSIEDVHKEIISKLGL